MDELSSLKNQLAEKERALATARTSAHSTNMDSQEVCVCVYGDVHRPLFINSHKRGQINKKIRRRRGGGGGKSIVQVLKGKIN